MRFVSCSPKWTVQFLMVWAGTIPDEFIQTRVKHGSGQVCGLESQTVNTENSICWWGWASCRHVSPGDTEHPVTRGWTQLNEADWMRPSDVPSPLPALPHGPPLRGSRQEPQRQHCTETNKEMKIKTGLISEVRSVTMESSPKGEREPLREVTREKEIGIWEREAKESGPRHHAGGQRDTCRSVRLWEGTRAAKRLSRALRTPPSDLRGASRVTAT